MVTDLNGFRGKGPLNRLARGNEFGADSKEEAIPQLVKGRGIKELSSDYSLNAEADKHPLYNAVLKNNGQVLSSANTKSHSPEKALQAALSGEMSKIPSREISR